MIRELFTASLTAITVSVSDRLGTMEGPASVADETAAWGPTCRLAEPMGPRVSDELTTEERIVSMRVNQRFGST